jgi:hypothetical protein
MTLPTTGHQTFFMNTSRYFMTMGGARGAGGTGGAVGAGMARPTPPVLGGAAAGGGTPRPAAGARR